MLVFQLIQVWAIEANQLSQVETRPVFETYSKFAQCAFVGGLAGATLRNSPVVKDLRDTHRTQAWGLPMPYSTPINSYNHWLACNIKFLSIVCQKLKIKNILGDLDFHERGFNKKVGPAPIGVNLGKSPYEGIHFEQFGFSTGGAPLWN